MTSERTVSRSEDGEFELILGNRQLLSVFFIVVVLLGVFFTMGYIVGKNAVTATDLAARKSDPVMVDPSKPSSFGTDTKPVAAARSTPAVDSAAEAKETRRQEAERKEAERRADAESKADARRRADEDKKADLDRKAETRKAEARETRAAAPNPVSGQTYLQVVASSKPDCEIIADVLRRKGFGATVVAGPTEKVFRVVVGPLNDAAAITRTRSDLEAAGFQKPVIKKF